MGRKRSSTDTGNLRALADEAELIRRCCAGERSAQEELYHRHRRAVAANLYRVMNDRTDLDDLVQEVFVIAFRGLHKFRREARLSTWLYRICVNVALGRIRTKTRRPPPILLADPDSHHDSKTAESPEQAMRRQQDRERVHRVMELLPPKKRIVFMLHEIEGMDLKEISFIVGAHPVTVRTRLHYARREFYKLLAQEPE